jgi:holo-[acyl-carrier protein] synthase
MIGIGIDAVDIERFRRSLTRTPGIRTRLFTPAELDYVADRADPVPALAARFAAREAAMKALDQGLGVWGFHDLSVTRDGIGPPKLLVVGRAAEVAAEFGVVAWRVSLTHTDTVAMAVVAAL